jgi:hypothetical protein
MARSSGDGLAKAEPKPNWRVGLKALAPDRQRGAENLQWALINSPEFIFSY